MNWWDLAWVTHPAWLAVNALAAFRLTRLWVADMLPPLPRIRRYIETRATARWEPEHAKARSDDYVYDPDPGPKPPESDHKLVDTWQLYGGQAPLAYFVTCPWCSGFWISLIVFLLATLFPPAVWAFVAVPLAFSAVAGLLHQATE